MIVTPDQRHSWYKTAADRFGLNLFMALALHGFLILAISFKLPETPPPQQTLDITLVQQASETPPEDADFLPRLISSAVVRVMKNCCPVSPKNPFWKMKW